jgi:hypothetical protein
MDMTKYAGGDYIRVDDVRNGPIVAQITLVREGPYGKAELELNNDQMFTLNRGNTKRLVDAFGADGDDWCGRWVKLSLGQAKYKDEMVDSVVIEPDPARQKKRRPSVNDSDGGL